MVVRPKLPVLKARKVFVALGLRCDVCSVAGWVGVGGSRGSSWAVVAIRCVDHPLLILPRATRCQRSIQCLCLVHARPDPLARASGPYCFYSYAVSLS